MSDTLKKLQDSIVAIQNLEWERTITRREYPRNNEIVFLRRTLGEPYFDQTDDRYNPGYAEAAQSFRNQLEDLEKKAHEWYSLELVDEVCSMGKLTDNFWSAMDEHYTSVLGPGVIDIIRLRVEVQLRRQNDISRMACLDEHDLRSEYASYISKLDSRMAEAAIQMAELAKDIALNRKVELVQGPTVQIAI
jgi:hypothetical protein